MRVKDILQEKGGAVITIDAGQNIHAAITKLNHHGIGALIALEENGTIAGIITERDVMQNCGNRCGRLKEPPTPEEDECAFLVKDIMTKELVIGVPSDDLNYVMNIMTKNRIRHLPILDRGQLAGMISIGDLVNAHFEEKIFENRTLKEYVHAWAHKRD